MSRLIAILALVLSVAPPIERGISVVFVVPDGEQLTADEQATAMQSIASGAAFWQDHSPIATSIPIVGSSVVTVTGDVYGSLEWAIPYLVDDNPGITVFVIDNSNSRRWLFGDAVGEAQDYYGAAWVVLDGIPGDDGLAAVVAHELGHVVYGLDDLPAGPRDMMRMPPTVAYRDGAIGCTSLAALGAPCQKVYLPFVVRG